MSQSLRYSILGTGALGGYYGGLLAKAGFPVSFLLRSDFEHVRKNGLRVETKTDDFTIFPAAAYDAPEKLPPSDVVIVAFKATENHQLSNLLPQATRHGEVVLLLQNGLAVERDAEAIVGEGRVLGGCCFLCSNKVGPGHIRHLDYGRIVLGWPTEQARQIGNRTLPSNCIGTSWEEKIADDFNRAGIPTTVSDSLPKTRWQKLMWNIPYNGLSVALDASTDAIMNDVAATQLVKDLMTEVLLGAAACGHNIESTLIEKLMEDTRKMVPYDSSMRLDYRAGRAMELETIFARPIQAARQAGFVMNKVEMLYQQLQFLGARSLANR